MKTIGTETFPTSSNDEWHPSIYYRALHSQVLVVARTRAEGAWKAYCGPVAGMNHDLEARDENNGPLHDGDDVGETVARVLFPFLADIPYAR